MAQDTPLNSFFRLNSEAAPPCHKIKQVFWRLLEETPMAGYGKKAIMRIADLRYGIFTSPPFWDIGLLGSFRSQRLRPAETSKGEEE